ncbi:epimerase [Agilicoccus flavus]|uniref:epimerase n=1 Tax=Agilicoccus flavus TaxID=2775968 RepID=UPI001CF62781|nr:epimerase [Agilicoccus flavus]
MRILVVGATGVIDRELVPRLVAAGHAVTGTSRSPAGVDAVRALGAHGRVLDVYVEATVGDVLGASDPEVLVCQVSDLPDSADDLPDSADDLPARRAANARIRREAIPRLLAAARAHGVGHLLVQSVAWPMTGEGAEAVAVMEEATLAAGGVVLRYGQFYGPGTFHARPPDGPAVAVGDAAARTADLLLAPSSVVTITDAPTPAVAS